MNLGKQDGLAMLLVALAAFAVYANALGNGFVWDDWTVIVNNPVLREPPGSLFGRIDAASEVNLTPYYRPLTILTFWADLRLHGLRPFPMHLVSVLLHAANAVLTYGLARSLAVPFHGAVLVGLLMAVHPINTESVDFVSARNTLLSGFFVLATCELHRRRLHAHSFRIALAGAAFFLAGLFSKETSLAVLPILFLLELPYLRSGAPDERRQAVFRLIPYVIVMLGYFVVRWVVLSSQGIQTGILPGFGTQGMENLYIVPGLGERLMNNIYIIPRYFALMVWPLSLSPTHQMPVSLQPLVLPLIGAWLALLAGIAWILTRGRSPAALFGLAWFVVFWLPVSGIIFFPSNPIAERFLYLPAIGIWLIVADQATRAFGSDGRVGWVAMCLAGGVLLFFASVTVARNLDWKSDLTLYARDVQRYPDNPASHAGLGQGYLNENSDDPAYLALAERSFEKALALKFVIPGVHSKMGFIRLKRGDSEGAVKSYSVALSINPMDREALLNRAIALENLGRTAEAVADFRRFLATPGHEYEDARPYAEMRIRELSR